jgi:hypothetical protein
MKRLWVGVWVLAIAACGTDHHGAGIVPTGGACAASDDCASAYCAWPDGHVCTDGTRGTCTASVANQICSNVEDPVCGCDGMTYANACYANSAGESVASKGACH